MMPNMMVMGAVADRMGLPNSPEGQPSAPLPLRMANGAARFAAGDNNPYLEAMKLARAQAATAPDIDEMQAEAMSERIHPMNGKPVVNNQDGSISTERTITVEMDGQHFVVPTLYQGKQYSPEEAVGLMQRGLNKPVGVFNSAREAEEFAVQRSQSLGRSARPTPGGQSMSSMERIAMLNEATQAEQYAEMERELNAAERPATRSIAEQTAAPDPDAMREMMAPVLEAAKQQAEFKKEVNTRVSKADRGGRDMGTARDDGGADYKIAKGDTLTAIAKRFNVPLADLARANGITRGTMNFIRAGDMLIIPGKQSDPVEDTPSEALQPAPIKAAAQDVPRGESILAEKIRAANQPQSFGDRLRALTEGFSNNPDNVATAETAAGYLGAAAALNPFARAMQGLRGLAAGRGAAPIAQRVDPNRARMQAFRQRAPQRIEPSLREMDRIAPKNLGGRQEPDMNYLMQLFQRRQGR
jgi:LysM repeat protein